MKTELIVPETDDELAEANTLVMDLIEAGDVVRLRAQALLVQDYETRHRPPFDQSDYEAAFDRIAELWTCEAGTPEAAELEALVDLVEAYEERSSEGKL